MEEPTLGEVVRTLQRFEAEVSRRLDDLADRFERTVAADVYEAHRQAMLADIAGAKSEVSELRDELAEEKKERRADRRMYIGSLLSLVVAVVAAALIVALGLK